MSRAPVTDDTLTLADPGLEDDIRKALELHRRLRVGLLHIDVGAEAMERGHGDDVTRAVLQETAFRIDRAIRRTDARAHVRFGHFVVVLPGLGTQGDLQLVAEGLYKALREPFLVTGRSVTITLHLGAALTSSRFGRPNRLLHDAAQAVEEAQRRGTPLHVSAPRFASITRTLTRSETKARRGDRGTWRGRRMDRVERATTTNVA